MFGKVIAAFFGPRLYRYLVEQPERRFLQYEPIFLESWANTFIGFANTFISFSRHAWFIVVPYMYVRGYFTREGLIYMAYFVGIVTLLYLLSFTARGLGRLANPVYTDFLRVYLKDFASHKERKLALSKFSYDFHKWESDFDVRDPARKNALSEFKPTFNLDSALGDQSLMTKILKAPYDIACYCLMNVIGRRMIYPGSMQFLNALVAEPREDARAKIQSKDPSAERLKLTTSLGESVDAFIVDKRNSNSDNGNKIVICTEGNGGFYEVGIMATPLDAGFSVIGWNHPGFGGSTGEPYPENEHAAIDAVYKYVRSVKGFKDEDIILFGWSIGGYATGWLAMNYPNIHAVMIDASFDDLVPLATSKMPAFASGAVTRGIRKYMDLRVAEQLSKYPGAMLLYRRTKDEIITTQMRHLRTNRVNDLVLYTIKHRYPELFLEDGKASEDLEEHAKAYCSVPLAFHEPIVNLADIRKQIEAVRAEELESGLTFPSKIGEGKSVAEKEVYIEFMIQAYMADLEDVHCTPLPTSLFRVPKQL